MTFQNNPCEYTTTLKRSAYVRAPDEIRYAQLWTEIELPRLLKRGDTP